MKFVKIIVIKYLILASLFMANGVYAEELFCKKYNEIIGKPERELQDYKIAAEYLMSISKKAIKAQKIKAYSIDDLSNYINKTGVNESVYVYIGDDYSVLSRSFQFITMKNVDVINELKKINFLYIDATDINSDMKKIIIKFKSLPPALLKIKTLSNGEFKVEKRISNKCIDEEVFSVFLKIKGVGDN